MFTIIPVLMNFNPEKRIIVGTDNVDYVSAGILSQHDHAGNLHPVAFNSKRNSTVECNYELYNKKLLAIIHCVEKWWCQLQSTGQQIQVLTDHRHLEYFTTSKVLKRRLARWAKFCYCFNFEIKYHQGKQRRKPRALTKKMRRSAYKKRTKITPPELGRIDRREFGCEASFIVGFSIKRTHWSNNRLWTIMERRVLDSQVSQRNSAHAKLWSNEYKENQPGGIYQRPRSTMLPGGTRRLP